MIISAYMVQISLKIKPSKLHICTIYDISCLYGTDFLEIKLGKLHICTIYDISCLYGTDLLEIKLGKLHICTIYDIFCSYGTNLLKSTSYPTQLLLYGVVYVKFECIQTLYLPHILRKPYSVG